METNTGDGESGMPEVVRGHHRKTGTGAVARLSAGAALVLVLLAAGVAVLIAGMGASGASRPVALPSRSDAAVASATPTAAPGTSAALYVHVLGAVGSAGLYVLSEGQRVVDAIAAAGGFAPDAERGGVNLARPLADGEQIVVPRIGEAPVPAEAAPASGSSAGGLVNLNTATAAQLEALPRIGPAMAQRIVDHRETNGPFTSVDQLLDVTGIGEKTLEGFRDLVGV